MSAVYTILCRRPIDASGRADLVSVRGLPLEVEVVDVESWRAAARRGPEANIPRLAEWLAGRWGAVVRLTARPVHAELASQCAIALAAALGGGHYDDHACEPSETHPGDDDATVRSVVSTWTFLANDDAEVDRREHDLARREWAVRVAADPGFAADDDWSDV